MSKQIQELDGVDLIKRLKLMRLMREFHGIQSSIRGFSGDVVQLLIFANCRVDDLETRTYKVRTTMADMSLNNVPLREQLKTMIHMIEKIGQSLRQSPYALQGVQLGRSGSFTTLGRLTQALGQ